MPIKSFLVILLFSLFSHSSWAQSGAVAQGHNDVSCQELPTQQGDESVEPIDLSEMDSPQSPSEHTWKPEWTQFAMDCMNQHGQDLLNTYRPLPDDYQEYCGGEFRQHVESERRLFLLSVLVATARYESTFDPTTQADIEAMREAGLATGENQSNDDPPTGLFQMGQGDCPNGGSCDMKDPETAICAAVKKANDQITEDNVFAGCKNSETQTCEGDEWGGMAAYWEVHRTMNTNDAILKANAIKNAVRGVCACGSGTSSFAGGGLFSNIPESWRNAALEQRPGGNPSGSNVVRYTPSGGVN